MGWNNVARALARKFEYKKPCSLRQCLATGALDHPMG